MPVLFGLLNSTNVIEEVVNGLSIQGPIGASACPKSIYDLTTTFASFGYDTITGCTLHLTREQLKDFCCTGAPGSCLDGSATANIKNSPFVSSSGLPFFLNFTSG